MGLSFHGLTPKSREPGPQRPWAATAASAMGAIAFHLLLIYTFSFGTQAGRPSRDSGGPSAVELPATGEAEVSAIIFLDPSSVSRTDAAVIPHIRLTSIRRKEFRHPTLLRLSPPRFPLSRGSGVSSARKASAAIASVDGAEAARLFGVYVDQVSARIQEGWVRPQVKPGGEDRWNAGPVTGSPPAAAFSCKVQIVQSREGQVLEVTLLACDSNPEWQQSLVDAIDAASPLPAPPVSSIFARSLVMTFSSGAPPSGLYPRFSRQRVESGGRNGR